MAEIRVNPTRMELKKQKTKLTTARRGHKLLKNKCDELMKQFLDIVRESKKLRRSLETSFSGVFREFEYAAAETDPRILREALLMPAYEGKVSVKDHNMMSVIVPEFKVEKAAGRVGGAGYGFAFTSPAIDSAVSRISDETEKLIRLATLEKTAQLLCVEIEKTRRRVNALEYILIPQYEHTIKVITMKLDENERSNLTRLMKVKDMMLEKSHPSWVKE
ncbi:MAG: V-type ATP synthase subunit D [Clostridia bacterium]|nr:V-type ATP synthase subunit D [Clostridia bacterium]MBR3991080.1 V-type ATP synthase subunit D [Clostridia bacterium]